MTGESFSCASSSIPPFAAKCRHNRTGREDPTNAPTQDAPEADAKLEARKARKLETLAKHAQEAGLDPSLVKTQGWSAVSSGSELFLRNPRTGRLLRGGYADAIAEMKLILQTPVLSQEHEQRRERAARERARVAAEGY